MKKHAAPKQRKDSSEEIYPLSIAIPVKIEPIDFVAERIS